MRILIAPDAFKGSLNQTDAARAIRDGILSVDDAHDTRILPISDGGEGMLDVCRRTFGGTQTYTFTSEDPLGRPVTSEVLYQASTRTLFVEMARVSGLLLMGEDERDIRRASTYGLGRLVRQAMDACDVRRLTIGIGGSATDDGGAGFLQALGVRMLDRNGDPIGRGNTRLADLTHVDFTGFNEKYADLDVLVLSDVNNPLLGEDGATHTYAPQKGATDGDVAVLERNIAHYHHIIKKTTGIDHADRQGAGAAGGTGYALMMFPHVRVTSGADYFLAHAESQGRFRDIDVILTGEGAFDRQSLHGKVIGRLAHKAKEHDVPLIVLCGTADPELTRQPPAGVRRVVEINDPALPKAMNMRMTNIHLKDAARRQAEKQFM